MISSRSLDMPVLLLKLQANRARVKKDDRQRHLLSPPIKHDPGTEDTKEYHTPVEWRLLAENAHIWDGMEIRWAGARGTRGRQIVWACGHQRQDEDSSMSSKGLLGISRRIELPKQTLSGIRTGEESRGIMRQRSTLATDPRAEKQIDNP